QYDRRLNILVHGIPEKDGEITNDLFIDMCDSIQVNIKQTDISTSHRLGKKCVDKNRPIICRLLRYDTRKELFSNKNKLKQTENYKRVNIAEDLTNYNLQLFKRARLILVKNNVYALNGRIWYSTASGKIMIRSDYDIEQAKLEN
ncbi:unnamed protein product, partial [Didymodactylos carnosus]